MDKLTREQRTLNMSRVKGRDTKLELLVRKRLYREGFRFRLYYKLPGKPDIVFISRKTAIFIHGCFWHQHGCKKSSLPASNVDFWKTKLEKNRLRDAESLRSLSELGWDSIIIWECEINNSEKFESRIAQVAESLKRK